MDVIYIYIYILGHA